MTWDATPWFVGGGAQHSPEVARLLAYAATGGVEGIVEVGDLKVVPLDVPGGAVRARPGGALIRNRSAGGSAQTYAARLPQADEVEIAATGSAGGRSDMIVARIEDPFTAGAPWQDPADPTTAQYVYTRVISNVPADATTLADAGVSDQSAIPLARVDLPASTGTVTANMITDLRQVAAPRKERSLLVKNLAAGEIYDLGSSNFQQWPNENFDLFVPEWATRMNVIADWVQVRVSAGDRAGEVWVRFHDGESWPSTARNRWDLTGVPNTSRIGIRSAAPMSVPAAFRGQTVRVNLMGRNVSGGSGQLRLDGSSSVTLDVEFLERAV